MAPGNSALRLCSDDAVGWLGQQDATEFAIRVIYHAAAIVKNHGLVAAWIAGSPGQAGLARVSRAGEIDPGGGHLLRQCLRFRRVAAALFATLSVIEAEGEFRSMPRSRVLKHGGLPGEVMLVDRALFCSCFSLTTRWTLLRDVMPLTP